MSVPSLDILDFTNKVIIVTGASSGIGAATAKALAHRGGLMALVARDEKRLTSVAKVCEAACGNKPLCLLLDITIDGNCDQIADKTVKTFGKIDVLINCAGKSMMTSLFDTSMDTFDDLVSINLRTPYKMTQVCVPHLKKTKGNIVNVFGGPDQKPGFLPLGMINDAMSKFTRLGASELASVGIRMNAVQPGLTRTKILLNMNIDEESLEHVYECITDWIPNCRILEPEEVANMIVFVASSACPNMIGSGIVLRGMQQT